jgi:tRNA A37 threonylcarbamoyladenosine dehydratase
MAAYTEPTGCGDPAASTVNAKAALISWCKRRKVRSHHRAGGQIDPTQIQVVT